MEGIPTRCLLIKPQGVTWWRDVNLCTLISRENLVKVRTQRLTSPFLQVTKYFKTHLFSQQFLFIRLFFLGMKYDSLLLDKSSPSLLLLFFAPPKGTGFFSFCLAVMSSLLPEYRTAHICSYGLSLKSFSFSFIQSSAPTSPIHKHSHTFPLHSGSLHTPQLALPHCSWPGPAHSLGD